MPTKSNKPITFTVTRSARKGRPVSAETLSAHSTLDKRWSVKSDRSTVNVEDDKGTTVDSYSALVVQATDLGKSATYTGMVGLIAGWAKASGNAVKVSRITDTHYAIRAKG